MPIWLWFVIGGGAAYLIAKSGSAAASSASTTLSVRAANGTTYPIPIDANLPANLQAKIQTFFGMAGQTDATVQTFATQLVAAGYPVAAGSVQNLWAMIVAATGPLTQAPSSGGAGIGLHGMGSLGGSAPASAPTASPYASPSTLSTIHLAQPSSPPITFKAP